MNCGLTILQLNELLAAFLQANGLGPTSYLAIHREGEATAERISLAEICAFCAIAAGGSNVNIAWQTTDPSGVPTNNEYLVVNTANNSFWVYDITDGEWIQVNGGDGLNLTWISSDPVAAPTNNEYLQFNTVNGAIWLWDDVNNSWTQINAPQLDIIYDAEAATGEDNVAMVRASGPGVTFVRSAGSGVFNIPSGVVIKHFSVNGVTADTVSDAFSIVFDYNGIAYNTGYLNMFPPVWQVINTTSKDFAGPSDVQPFIYDEGADPQKQLISLTGGNLTIRAINLVVFGAWTMVGNL